MGIPLRYLQGEGGYPFKDIDKGRVGIALRYWQGEGGYPFKDIDKTSTVYDAESKCLWTMMFLTGVFIPCNFEKKAKEHTP